MERFQCRTPAKAFAGRESGSITRPFREMQRAVGWVSTHHFVGAHVRRWWVETHPPEPKIIRTWWSTYRLKGKALRHGNGELSRNSCPSCGQYTFSFGEKLKICLLGGSCGNCGAKVRLGGVLPFGALAGTLVFISGIFPFVFPDFIISFFGVLIGANFPFALAAFFYAAIPALVVAILQTAFAGIKRR